MRKILSVLVFVFFAATSWATVDLDQRRIKYSCDGSMTSYTYPFQVIEDNDLIVIRSDKTSFTETVLILNVDYTVTGAGVDGGGTVELTAGSSCDAGSNITILRDVELLQEIDLVDGEAYSAETLENGYDKAMLIAQDQRETIDRTVLIKASSDLADIEWPNPAPNQAIGWDASGTALTNMQLAGATSTIFDHIGNYADLASAVSAIGAASTTLVIDEATVIADGVTVTTPETLTLMPIQGGLISGISGGGTEAIVINGPILAGNYIVFGDDITVTVGKPQTILSSWVGTIPDDSAGSGTDNSDAFAMFATMVESVRGNTAIIPPGYYYTTGKMAINIGYTNIIASGAVIRGNNISGYILEVGDSDVAADRRDLISITGGEWNPEGTTTGAIAAYYCPELKIADLSIIGDGTNAIEIQACWLGVMEQVFIKGDFLTCVYSAIHDNTYKNNGFNLKNNWFHGKRFVSQLYGLHIEDGAVGLISSNNYYEGMDGTTTMAIYAESAVRFRSDKDQFEDCTHVGKSANPSATWINPVLGGTMTDGIEIDGNYTMVYIQNPLVNPTGTGFIVKINGDNCFVSSAITASTRVVDNGSDNTVFNNGTNTYVIGDITLDAGDMIVSEGSAKVKSLHNIVTDLEPDATLTLDWGLNRVKTLTQNVTTVMFPTTTASDDGRRITISIKQSNTSSYTVAGWDAVVAAVGIGLQGGAYTMTSTVEAIDHLEFVFLYDHATFVEVSRSQDVRK